MRQKSKRRSEFVSDDKERDESYWLNKPGSPKAKLANEKPQGETLDYDKLLQAWKEGRVK